MNFNPNMFPYINPHVDRRVALVTGGNSGIGYYTALHLYMHGYIVYVAGRSKSRVLKSLNAMREEARLINKQHETSEGSNDANFIPFTRRYLGELEFLEIDLLSLSSVLKAVNQFKKMESSLHILVNNAGVTGFPYQVTEDNFELQMQTNYVGPFLLTLKLIPLLEKEAERQRDPPRIISVTSIGHYFAFKYFSMDSKFDFSPNILFTWFRYGLAKMAAIHFTKLLALRNPSLLCFSVHPGFVMSTNFFSYWTRLPIIGVLFWCFFQIFGYFFGVSNEDGSYATLRCCLDPTLTLETDNGKYITTGGRESTPSPVANNMDYAARTWIWTIHHLTERNIHIDS